jgi:hypothetical protein
MIELLMDLFLEHNFFNTMEFYFTSSLLLGHKDGLLMLTDKSDSTTVWHSVPYDNSLTMLYPHGNNNTFVSELLNHFIGLSDVESKTLFWLDYFTVGGNYCLTVMKCCSPNNVQRERQTLTSGSYVRLLPCIPGALSQTKPRIVFTKAPTRFPTDYPTTRTPSVSPSVPSLTPVYDLPICSPTQSPSSGPRLNIQPSQKPKQPSQSPRLNIQPTQSSIQPSQSPILPSQTPIQPSQSPIQPTQKPIQPTQKPIQQSQSPSFLVRPLNLSTLAPTGDYVIDNNSNMMWFVLLALIVIGLLTKYGKSYCYTENEK